MILEAKLPKNTVLAKRAHFEMLGKKLKNLPRVVFDEESKSGLDFKIGQRQQTCQRKPNLQSLANPDALFHTPVEHFRAFEGSTISLVSPFMPYFYPETTLPKTKNLPKLSRLWLS